MASPLAGLGSSLDINSMISQLMAVERAPIDNLSRRSQKYQAELSAYGSVKGALAGVQSAAEALSAQLAEPPANAGSSNPAAASGVARAGVAASSHALEVHALARAGKLYSKAYASSAATVGGGTLLIEFGRTAGSAFTPASPARAITLEIPAASSLADVRDAVNGSASSVSAAIVNDGAGERLVLTAAEPGAGSSFRITVTDADGEDGDDEGLSALAHDPAAEAGTGRNMFVAQEARDAEFTLDGLRMTRPSNTVADAAEGLTLSLSGTGSTLITVSPDSSAARGALDNLVKAYNAAVTTLKSLSSYDTTTRSGSVLLGEATVRSLQSELRGIVNGLYGDTADSRRTLSAVGVILQSDGLLAVNAQRYASAAAAAPAELARVIGGAATAFRQVSSRALSTDGPVAARTNGIQSSIRQLADQQTRIEARMSAIEARYRAQFSALESLVSTMTRTNDYLSAQFESLRNSNK